MPVMTDAELDQIKYPDNTSVFYVARRIMGSLESIDGQLKALNETLSSVVSDFNYQGSPGKTYTAVRTYESNK